MHLGERETRGQVPVSLADTGTGEPARTVRPYDMSGGPPCQILSPPTEGPEIQAPERPETPEHRPRRDLKQE